jgi:hypothetical protein
MQGINADHGFGKRKGFSMITPHTMPDEEIPDIKELLKLPVTPISDELAEKLEKLDSTLSDEERERCQKYMDNLRKEANAEKMREKDI